MLQTITELFKRLKREKRGISNVIVVMLSLILLVIIVSNVVLWSYQMNQFDLERIQENVKVANVTRVTHSSWFTAQTEYTIIAGSRLSGTYTDTKFLDSSYETFIEEKTQIFNPNNYILGGSTKHVSGNVLNLASNDNAYMNFRSYPNYEVRYQESLGVSSTTSTAYQDKVSIVFTPQITADFVIIATAEVQGTNTNYQAKAQLTVNSTTYQELMYRIKDTTDWYPFCGLKRISLNESASYSIKVQFCTNNVAATASIRNARLIVMSIQSTYAESEELSTTDSTNWQDKVTLAFTPPSDGEYLIIATANYRGSQTNRDVNIRLVQDDAIVHADTIGRAGTGTIANYYTFGVMRKVNLTSTFHNFKIQYCSSGVPGIAGINYAHIAAIRLNQFDNDYYSEDENESIPAASNTWYDKVVNNYAADAGNHLIIGSIAYKSGSTLDSVGLDFQTGSMSRQLPLVEHRNTQNWTQLEWATDSSFTTTDVATTFQLYDYQASQYPTSGDGYMTDNIGLTDVTKNQTITTNPINYRDADGNWKIKIKGVKATDTQFELRADWVEFKVTTSDVYQLNINNNFTIDLLTYPLDYIRGIEIYVKYNVTEAAEKWFLKAYNWTLLDFSSSGFNNTEGSQPAPSEWTEYAINITEDWVNYLKDDGTLFIEFFDEGLNTNQTMVEIDFFGVRAIIDSACFDLRNAGSMTTHVVSIWIINSTNHQRYDANLFINAGQKIIYIRVDISLPEDNFIAKVVTERGNIAVFSAD